MSCSAPGQPLDATRSFPHYPRHHRLRPFQQAERRLARALSALSAARRRGGAASACHRGLEHPASEAGDGPVARRHADLDVRRDVSRFHGRARSGREPARSDERTQLDPAPHQCRAIRNDPEWNNGDYDKQPSQLGPRRAALRADDAERRPHPGAGADAREGRCALSAVRRAGAEGRCQQPALSDRIHDGLRPVSRTSRRSRRGSSPSTSPTMRSIRPSWACWRPVSRAFPARVRSWCRPGRRARATTPRCAQRSGRVIWPIFWDVRGALADKAICARHNATRNFGGTRGRQDDESIGAAQAWRRSTTSKSSPTIRCRRRPKATSSSACAPPRSTTTTCSPSKACPASRCRCR